MQFDELSFKITQTDQDFIPGVCGSPPRGLIVVPGTMPPGGEESPDPLVLPSPPMPPPPPPPTAPCGWIMGPSPRPSVVARPPGGGGPPPPMAPGGGGPTGPGPGPGPGPCPTGYILLLPLLLLVSSNHDLAIHELGLIHYISLPESGLKRRLVKIPGELNFEGFNLTSCFKWGKHQKTRQQLT